MIFKKSNFQDEELTTSPESDQRNKIKNSKPLVIYIFKRIFYYSTLLQGIITIFFFILYFTVVNKLEMTVYFLYFTLIMLVIYGLIAFIVHFLEKSYVKVFDKEPTETMKPITKINPELAKDLLQGKTLQVYWYIFTHDHAGIREIQKALNITSSGTIAYQVTKLLNAGIITRNELEGKYSINKEIKIGILKFFVRIGNRMIPRISLYLIIYILGFIIFLFLAFISGYSFAWNPLNLFLLLLLIIGMVIFIIESFRIWKLNPTK